MLNKIILLPALVLSLSLSTASFAEMHEMNGNNGTCPCKNMEKMAEGLDLTSEQKNKLEEIKVQAMGNMENNYSQMIAIKQQMHALIMSENMDQAKLDQLIKQKTDLMSQMMKNRATFKHQMYVILTPQQKVKFSDMMKKMESNMMERMKSMGKKVDNMGTSDMNKMDNDL